MFIVLNDGLAVNTERYHELAVWGDNFHDDGVYLLESTSIDNITSTSVPLYRSLDPVENRAFLSWLLRQMEDGKRVVRVSDFGREPVASGRGDAIPAWYSNLANKETNIKTVDDLRRNLDLPIPEEPDVETEGGEA